MLRFLAISALLTLAACEGSEPPDPSQVPPEAPAQNDAQYQTSGLRDWAIIGNEVDPGNESFELTVSAPAGTDYVDGWLAGGPGFRLAKQDGMWTASIDLSALEPGDYELLLAANGETTAFAKHEFKRSHPVYVVVTSDWDTANPGDASLDLQDQLHAEHPELVLTHFVGPYTFTDPEVSEARRDVLVAWVLGMKGDFQDEIGLHIHPRCTFVSQVGTILGGPEVECLITPSTVYSGGDTSGYTVRVSAYSVEDFTKQLLAADALFMERDLGKPTSFRAGGWTAELNTMLSLEAAGYVVDTSALNWARLDEWNGGFGTGTLYDWNKENWSSIGDTSQPYYPATDNLLETGAETIGVLQVPDNGILVDYVETSEMVEIFDANWDGGVATTPINYSIGYHPSNFSETYKKRITDALTHVDKFLASQDKGPVIYGRLSDMANVWKRPE